MKKGRFRKGKKAYCSDTCHRSGKQKVLAHKYAAHLERIRATREFMARLSMAALLMGSARAQAVAIAQQPRPVHMSPEDFMKTKVAAVQELVVGTAERIHFIVSPGVSIRMTPPDMSPLANIPQA